MKGEGEVRERTGNDMVKSQAVICQCVLASDLTILRIVYSKKPVLYFEIKV